MTDHTAVGGNRNLDPRGVANLVALSRKADIRLLVGVPRPTIDEISDARGDSMRANFTTRVYAPDRGRPGADG